LRIGIDISTLLNQGKDIGAGRYIINLVKNLFDIDREDAFVLTGRYYTDDYLSVIDELKEHYNKLHVSDETNKSERINPLNKIDFRIFKTTKKNLDVWNNLRFPAIEIKGFKADILHCPDFLIPPTLNKKIILTIYDLAFMRFPHFNFDWFIKKYTREVRRNATIARKIITSSKSTKNDVFEFLNVKKENIEVIYGAAEKSFKKIKEDELDYKLLEKLKIKNKFILSVGTIEPRKNYVTLIRAYNFLKYNYSDFRWRLVIVGRTGWLSEEAYKEYENSPYKDDIIFVGRISDKELIQIYNLAEIFVYPSIFEGFGLPVVEALQCGLPVLASNTSSIPEIIENKELLFNPADEEDIARKIFKVLKDERLRKELREKAIKIAEKFSWKKSAGKTLKIYKKIYEK
jgi:glycosyltransferase involved in cell wall biosynthesis